MPLATPVHGTRIPVAKDHLDFFPARFLALAGNSLGTLAVVGVVLWTIKRRPLGNSLILAGVAAAATGSAQGRLERRGRPSSSPPQPSCCTPAS
jgi:hypothetical protein